MATASERRPFRILVSLVALFPLVAAAAERGDRAPEFRLKDLEGRERTLSELRQGGAIVLDFGSIYCGSCQDVLRRLETLRCEREPGGLRVAAVNIDPPGAAKAVLAVMKGIRAGYPVLRDSDGRVAAAYGVRQIPHLVAIDARGIIRAAYSGLPPNLEEALRSATRNASEER